MADQTNLIANRGRDDQGCMGERGFCKACCFVQSEAKKADDNGDKETQDAVVAEKAFDSTVTRIKGSFSWASTGMLSLAISSTIVISFEDEDDWVTVLADWIYVLILFAIEIFLQTCTIDALDAPDSIGKELDTSVPPKKAARGDKVAKYEVERKKDKARKKKKDKSKKGTARRIFKFAEKATDKFTDNLFELFTAILANVIAVGVSGAFTDTFELFRGGRDLTIALLWGYALAQSSLTCYVAIKSGKRLDDLEIELYDHVYKCARKNNIRKRKKIWTNDEVYDDVVAFAARRRFYKLINYTLGLTMAWAWRDALKDTIISAYGGDTTSTTLTGLWIYLTIATFLVTYSNTIGEKYYLLYPKDENSAMQLNTQERKFIGTAIYKNAQIIVGIAWYDAVVETSTVLFNGWTNVAVLWISFVLFQVLSVLGEYYWQSLWIRFEMIEKGIVTAVYNAFDDLWDRDDVLENDEEEKEKSDKSYDFGILYLKELIELTVYAWGVAAGWTVGAATKAILIEIYDGTFDPDETEDISGNVLWSAWVAFFIILLISTCIMWFLSGIQETKKKLRQEQIKKAAQVDKDKDPDDTDEDDDDEKEELEQGQKNEQAGQKDVVIEVDDNGDSGTNNMKKPKLNVASASDTAVENE